VNACEGGLQLQTQHTTHTYLVRGWGSIPQCAWCRGDPPVFLSISLWVARCSQAGFSQFSKDRQSPGSSRLTGPGTLLNHCRLHKTKKHTVPSRPTVCHTQQLRLPAAIDIQENHHDYQATSTKPPLARSGRGRGREIACDREGYERGKERAKPHEPVHADEISQRLENLGWLRQHPCWCRLQTPCWCLTFRAACSPGMPRSLL